MPKFYLFCTLFLYVTTGWTADYQRTITWIQQSQSTDIKDVSAIGFEGSIILDKTGLPNWFESFDLNSSAAEVTISNAIFEPILHPSAGLIDYQETELKFKSEIGVSAGKSILRLTIFPFVRRNNQIEKLVKFTVSVSGNHNQLKAAVPS